MGTAPVATLSDGRRLLSRSRAAKLLGVSDPVLQRAIDRGDVPVTRLGYRVWVPSVVVEKLLTGAPVNAENSDSR